MLAVRAHTRHKHFLWGTGKGRVSRAHRFFFSPSSVERRVGIHTRAVRVGCVCVTTPSPLSL